MGSRRKGRELALQALYQLDMTGDDSERALAAFWEEAEATPEARSFAEDLVRALLPRRREIDGLIETAAENWCLDRLSRIDLNVMRLAIQEMTAARPLPVEIAINEAIEIARRFGAAESATFVNGVLDQIARNLRIKRRREGKVTQNDG